MSAKCGNCGRMVMSYRHYLLYLKPTAACQNCGRQVRLRWFNLLAVSAVMILGIAIVAFVSGYSNMGIFVVLGLMSIIMDYWSWKTFPWDVIPTTTNSDNDKDVST